jgi:hypothetical protein
MFDSAALLWSKNCGGVGTNSILTLTTIILMRTLFQQYMTAQEEALYGKSTQWDIYGQSIAKPIKPWQIYIYCRNIFLHFHRWNVSFFNVFYLPSLFSFYKLMVDNCIYPIDIRRLSRPSPAPSTCDFMYNRQRPLYIMVARNRNIIWPPPPQLSLHWRAALRTNSIGTQSAHKGKQGGRSRYYSHVYDLFSAA